MAGRHRAALAAAMWLSMLKGISLADAAGEIRRCRDVEITKTLQDRKLCTRRWPLTTSDKFEAIAWEQRFCRTCLSKCPASFLPQ